MPYIDVMLVLLIIFMITAPLLTQGIKVDLPKAVAQPIENQKDEPLVLSIDKEGRFFLNIGDKPETPVEDSVVLERVSAVLRRNPKTPVLVKGDQNVPYGRVVTSAPPAVSSTCSAGRWCRRATAAIAAAGRG